MFIHYNDLYGHTLTKGLMKFTIMVDHSLVIITLYRTFLSDPCPSVDKKRRNIAFSLCCIFTIWPCPSTWNPALGVIKFTILVDPSFFNITLQSEQCVCFMLGSKEEDFKRMMHFHYMTCFATPEHKNHCPGSHETFDFGKPFLGHYYYTLSLFEPLPWSRDDF